MKLHAWHHFPSSLATLSAFGVAGSASISPTSYVQESEQKDAIAQLVPFLEVNVFYTFRMSIKGDYKKLRVVGITSGMKKSRLLDATLTYKRDVRTVSISSIQLNSKARFRENLGPAIIGALAASPRRGEDFGLTVSRIAKRSWGIPLYAIHIDSLTGTDGSSHTLYMQPNGKLYRRFDGR